MTRKASPTIVVQIYDHRGLEVGGRGSGRGCQKHLGSWAALGGWDGQLT